MSKYIHISLVIMLKDCPHYMTKLVTLFESNFAYYVVFYIEYNILY